jgi:hypothetical protein
VKSNTSLFYYLLGAVLLMTLAVYLAYDLTGVHQKLEHTSSLDHSLAQPVIAEVQANSKSKYLLNTVSSGGLLQEEFKEVQTLSFREKIAYWSEYVEKNLVGRGKLLALVKDLQVADSAPLVPNHYNCTTYVETVAALARSQAPEDFVKNLIAIRYRGGQPSFEDRNHFPEADWIPNNEKAGIMKDITNDVAKKVGVAFQREEKLINRGQWLAAQVTQHSISRSLASLVSKDWVMPITAHVQYIGVSDIDHVLDQIPSGTILNLVHRSDPSHPVLITHQGLVIREQDRVLLRHASIGGKIRTSVLGSYLRGLVNQQKADSKWPLIGVNLVQINDSASASSVLSESK